MATLEDKINGMKAQHKAVKILNEYYAHSDFNVHVEETDEETDKNDKIDAQILSEHGEVWANIDIKSTKKEDTISYTTCDQLGNESVTSSAENNVNGIKLIFMFDCENSNTLYVVDMDKFYKLVKDSKVYNGMTKLMIRENGKLYYEPTKKGNMRNVDYYHMKSHEDPASGEVKYTVVKRTNNEIVDVKYKNSFRY